MKTEYCTLLMFGNVTTVIFERLKLNLHTGIILERHSMFLHNVVFWIFNKSSLKCHFFLFVLLLEKFNERFVFTSKVFLSIIPKQLWGVPDLVIKIGLKRRSLVVEKYCVFSHLWWESSWKLRHRIHLKCLFWETFNICQFLHSI